MMVEIVFGNK